MILTSMPVHLLAANVDHNNLSNNKSEIINNKTPVKVAKLETGNTAADLIKNPDQPAIYTLRTDYKVQRGEKYRVDYQPYIASVGEAATQAEKDKVRQIVRLPDLTGYEKPDDDYKIDYDTVKNAANGNNKTGNDTNGIRYQANKDFKYKAKSNTITIKHVFQDLEDFTKYTNPDGSFGDEGALITTQNGNTGSTMEVSPLGESDPNRKGFVPERESIIMQVPENAENFILEYRYNRAHYDVTFDTQGGTEIPARTLYYGQVIPKIADKSIPTKVGGEFQGWKPSVDLKTKDGKTYKANEIIKVGTNGANKNLDANLIMPASKVTFTAVWKDKEKSDYAIQFWAEKADHADGASLADKYDYIGTRVYKDQDTGSRPDLDNEPVKNIIFPDLDKARLNKIWGGARFNRGKDLYLNKFYVYNQALTHDQNKDPENVNLVKSVDSTGKTVYNIYYDRQVYDLYFTKSNAQPEKNTIYPEIWGYDPAKGEAVMLGGPGKPYHYKARFNEMMYKWPNDAKQTKGFTPGYQSFGWGPNYTTPNWPLHLDTPPYRLNADEFLDMANYTSWGGYTKKIDKGDGTTMDLDPLDFKTLSFGIKQDKPSIPHHMDFWMDGFKPGETIIRYDLVRTKADTSAPDYGHRYPRVQGFTPYGYEPMKAWPVIREGRQEDGRVDENEINELNDERDEITPNTCGTYYNNYGTKLPIGQLDFIPAFFSDSDEFGDVKEGGQEFEKNGYLQFHYKRNKYQLRFNYDPSKIKDDSEFNSTNQLDTFYEFPLKALSPDADTEESYKTENLKNILDNPENLKKLGLTDLVFNDPNDENKLKVKRPDNLSNQMVFKGWALDPAGSKLVWENPKETMPFHPVNLYAKWGEPDYKWKVTFDPNGGSLRNIKEDNLTTSRKKIQEGDIGQEEINTYAKKEANDGDKQVFTVIQRQKLVEPKYKPTRKGYVFMGWEVIRYKKNAQGDYTDEIDNSYRDTYKVPELYSFGNDVVAPVYLKAIWVPNARVDVKVEHYMLDKDYKLVKKLEDTLEAKRADYLVATTGDKQDDEYILAPHEELEQKLTGDLKTTYEEYNKRVKGNNTFFQQFRVEPAQILNTDTNKLEDNPKVTDNIFKFFYKPFRTREYKVNYIDERFKGKETQEGAAIIDQELVSNGNRHYDARNYRPIPGWKLVGDPQQQLFFDVDEDTNALKGINGTDKDEITFYYKDVRVIEVPGDKEPPTGYVRVTFKADKGGSFGKDKDGKDIKELNYDVIKGLKSELLPVPQELGTKADGTPNDKVEGKYYITPETGKKFTKWDKSPLLNKNTIIDENHTFTANFEWSGLTASGIVRTEAFKDDKKYETKDWSNNFAPTIDELKKQLVWREKDQVKDLPAGAEIKLFGADGNELTSDDQVYELVNEKNKADKDQLVRTVNVKAKVAFKEGKEPQELDIPITVYKNVYEALNKDGDKPLFLKEAEGKEAKDGGLKDVTGNYVKVTVQPTEKNTNKDAKVYYVNPKAWVNIPEVAWSEADKDKTDFLKWTADKDAQNEKDEKGKSTGVFDFSKRHKFTEETLIKPVFTNDVVEQKEGEDKPKVPDNFVKVVVDKTSKAVLGQDEKQTQTFWVSPTKEVTIPVASPTGKTEQEVEIAGLGKKKVNYVFKEWQKVQTGEADDKLTEVKPAAKIDLAKNKYTDKVTVIEAVYKKSIVPGELVPAPVAKKNVLTPKGDTPKPEDLIENIPGSEKDPLPNGTKITYEEEPNIDNPGDSKAKVKIEYPNGKTVVVEVPIKVVDNVVPQTGKDKPLVPEGYVKVVVDTTEKATANTKFEKTFWVKPNVEVTIPDILAPTGKQEKIGEVTKTNKFVKWKLEGSKPEKFFETKITDTFKDKESKIVATYEYGKNVEPKGKNNQWIPQGSNPSPKDFIENPYNDDDPNNKDNLPPGTKIEFAEGKQPDTNTPGKDKEATIKITYPNGETKEVPVKYNVTGDVVEQKEGEDKPKVPDNFVKVIVKTTDKATDDTKFEKTFWVKPNKEVTIPVNNPEGKSEDNKKYEFDSWTWENVDTKDKIKGTFTKDTVIVAQYKTTTKAKDIEQIPEVVSEIPIVSLNQSDIDKDWFKIKNKNDTDSKIKIVEITEKPATDSLGIQSGKAKVTFKNGSSRIITIKLKVVDDVIESKGDKKTNDVPDNYKLVILDSTSDALEQTKRYFWINPNKDITLKAFKPQGKAGKVFDKWERSLSINWNKEGITENVLTIKAIYKDETTPDQPGGQPGEVEKHGHRYIERVAGKDRVHTAINTSRRFFNKSRYVIIADSGNYPDALTATVLAHVLDAPILLNNTRYLEDDVAREIVRLGASEVIIVGGHKSISENVKSQLARYDQNSVQRIWGRDRYVTSSELAYEIQRLTGKVNKAIIASGENFPDALATAPLGSKEIAPILLVRRNQIDKKVDKALKDLNIKRVYVAGGPNSVSKELEEQLPQVIRRFNGRDRYETAVLVASYTYPESKEVFVASGEVFPDALVIGPVCARRKAPILLSRTTPVKVTDDYIEKSNIEYLYIIGGTNTIYAETAHKYAIED